MIDETNKIKKDGINVLSLFDGISCAKLALERAGIKINKYYSSEICNHALAIQNFHYSGDTSFIQLGDVCNIDGYNYSNEIDLVVFGSPCTNLSSINKTERTGLEGSESKLFYEALRIMGQIYSFQKLGKKLYFLMENVASMSKKDRDIITSELAVIFPDLKLYKINSADLSGANRRRYYWTNIPNIGKVVPTNVKYQDIVVNGYVDRDKANVLLGSNCTLTNGISRYFKMNIGNIIFKDKEFAALPTEQKLVQYPTILKQSGYVTTNKTKIDEYDFPNGCYRLPSVLESERLMTIPDGYVSEVQNVAKTNKLKAIGLSMTVEVIAHFLLNLKSCELQN
jgi:DNA (cytosine-5)-methyltransferase 3A